jgi:hypothetical protein
MTVEQRNAVQTVLNAGYAATVWPVRWLKEKRSYHAKPYRVR